MKNRFNITIKPGFKVVAHVARAGHVTGIVSKIDTGKDFVKAYGKRVTLECGMSFACDDVVSSVDLGKISYFKTIALANEAIQGFIETTYPNRFQDARSISSLKLVEFAKGFAWQKGDYGNYLTKLDFEDGRIIK